ncbi:unnamed protein product [Cuscuta epithymum]|uniref:Secreted protein n=1 Tax=Cuscuta epithymum TaxID=186058 RepID=A0AAV0G2X2_9ASTE|nr:unnamed protein product [Cuscuta epithymum]
MLPAAASILNGQTMFPVLVVAASLSMVVGHSAVPGRFSSSSGGCISILWLFWLTKCSSPPPPGLAMVWLSDGISGSVWVAYHHRLAECHDQTEGGRRLPYLEHLIKIILGLSRSF